MNDRLTGRSAIKLGHWLTECISIYKIALCCLQIISLQNFIFHVLILHEIHDLATMIKNQSVLYRDRCTAINM